MAVGDLDLDKQSRRPWVDMILIPECRIVYVQESNFASCRAEYNFASWMQNCFLLHLFRVILMTCLCLYLKWLMLCFSFFMFMFKLFMSKFYTFMFMLENVNVYV